MADEKEVMFGVPKGEEVELQEHRAMVYIPENAVSVTLNAKIFQNGKLMDVSKEMSMQEIQTAFRKADEGYIDDDDVFVLTDKGRQYLEDRKV